MARGPPKPAAGPPAGAGQAYALLHEDGDEVTAALR